MTERHDRHDPIERLRAADPAAGSTSDPSLPHVRDTLEGILMTDTETLTPAPAPTSQNRTPWLLAAAALLVIAGVVAAVTLGGDDSTTDDLAARGGEPITDPTESGPVDDTATDGPVDDPAQSGVTSCVESYDLTTLANREYAFDGTVLSVEGMDMTFGVNEWFTAETADGDADMITLNHQGYAGMLFAPDGPALEPGTRVLVAGDGGFVWSCGFTQLHDPTVADEWRTALG